MTASMVNGRTVIRDEPTIAKHTGLHGARIVYQQTRELTLDDGSMVYGCAHCDYVSDNELSIRPHLKAHKDRGVDRSKPNLRTLEELTLLEIATRLAKAQKAVEEYEMWKARALEAEKTLRQFQSAIKRLS